MNKKQALQQGYTSTGECGTSWDEMLVKVKAARNAAHHARLITEVALADGQKTVTFTVFTKPRKRVTRAHAASPALDTATAVISTSEAQAPVKAKARTAEQKTKAKKAPKKSVVQKGE